LALTTPTDRPAAPAARDDQTRTEHPRDEYQRKWRDRSHCG
jgi:hypothetical protein